MVFRRTALLAAIAAGLVATGCAARSAPPANVAAVAAQGDPRLYGLLDATPLPQARRDSIDAYVAEHGRHADELLAQAAEDPGAPVGVRINALLVLSERTAVLQLPVFRAALDDRDERVRAMAVSAMRRFMETRPDDALQLARRGLRDPSPDVQAQALHVVGERDAALLRDYERTAATTELRTIARDLVRVAEERGAPLSGRDGGGVLGRDTPHGYTLTFTARTHWPRWDAAVGDVSIERPGAPTVTITDVEAVAGVVPVFLSPEGEHAVYERGRQVVVRTLGSGAERVLGPGIAPRGLPFTDRFVYVREQPGARTEVRHVTRIRYDVVMGGFAADAEDAVLGDITALATFERHGGYASVRWMRVEDRGGTFFLAGEGTDTFTLPDPFGPTQ